MSMASSGVSRYHADYLLSYDVVVFQRFVNASYVLESITTQSTVIASTERILRNGIFPFSL